MPDPKNEDPTEDSTESSAGEVAENGPADTPDDVDTSGKVDDADTSGKVTEAADEKASEDEAHDDAAPDRVEDNADDAASGTPSEETESSVDDNAAAAPEDSRPDDNEQDPGARTDEPADPDPAESETVAMPIVEKTPDPADAKTVAMPIVEKAEQPDDGKQPEPPATDPSEAPTTQIPVRSHAPKAEPQRIAPRVPEAPRPEPAPFQPTPAPTRIPPSPRKKRAGWMVFAGVAAVVVIAVVAVIAFLQYRESNSPESHIRASVDEFVQALSAGDLATLQSSTCGGLAEFYATVAPEEFDSIHTLAVEQGSVPVVSSIDKVQITDDTAIVEVTAHPMGDPSDVTARTFDLALQGEEWKVCSE
ncbi:Rv0361 family membrane protein [Rhodococcus sp. SJ-2]